MQTNMSINKKELEKAILAEIRNIIRQKIPKLEAELNHNLQNILEKHFLQGLPVIAGQDFNELGIPDIQDRLTSIALSASNDFRIKIFQRSLLNINIGILETSYKELLKLPEAIFTYSSKSGSNVLPYLKWLLVEGSTPVISEYDFMVKPDSGRTTGGIMIKTNNWKVPPNLQGTINDNLLTRCLSNIENDLRIMVESTLKKALC
jgi:hypothetical protein